MAAAHLERAEQAAERMATMIDALLHLSRSTRLPLRQEPVDLDALPRQAVDDLAPDVADRRVEWRLAQLPTVEGDAATLRQVLSDLLGNAVKFMRPRDPAVIEVWSERRAVFVRDNGVGFDPQDGEQIFGALKRLHTDREFERTGVGLATVRRIVLRHGGTVHADGAPGRGATFTFTLAMRPG